MKKFISLVLALVMTMSLVTISAGAQDFTDDSDITYAEAVDVMTAVKVVDGYADGSFNPQGTLTRGAAAKIICNLILGPTNAGTLSADTAPYSDVPANHTFASYIAYCQKEGIISGYSDGTFRPSSNLTGYAFMKMLLGALGYDADIEGYVGSNWSINVAKQALSIDLDDGYVGEFVGTKAVNREEAMLFAFNTLKATMVEYDSKTSVTVNGATVNVGNEDATDMEWAGGTGNKNDGTIESDGLVQFGEKYFSDLKKVTGTSEDEFGRPATEWKYKSTSVGTYGSSGDLEGAYENGVSCKTLYNLLGKSVVDDIEDGDAYCTIWVDGMDVTDTYADGGEIVDALFDKNSSASAGFSGRGVITEVYVDDDYVVGDDTTTMVTVVFIRQYLMQATSDYSSSKEELSVELVDDTYTGAEEEKMDDAFQQAYDELAGINTIELDDFDVEDYEEDDYILVTYSCKEEEIQSVQKAELLTGEVDTYRTKDSVTIGGETYKYSKLVGATHTETDFDIGSEAVLVLDSMGHIIYIDDADSSGSLVYITEFANSSNLGTKAIASAYFTDGTYDEITVKKLSRGGDTTESKKTIGDLKEDGAGWYTYSVNSSDEYTLKQANGSYTDYKETAKTLEGNNTKMIKSETVSFATGLSAKGNKSTVFIVLDEDDDVDVYVGINKAPDITVPTGDTITVAAVKDVDDTYAEYVFIDARGIDSSKIKASSSSDDYMFLLTVSGKVNKLADDAEFRYADAIVDGELTVIQVNNDDYDSDVFVPGRVYTDCDIDSDGFYTDVEDAIENESDVTGAYGVAYVKGETDEMAIDYDSDSLMIGGKEFILDDDVEITLVVGNWGNYDHDLIKDVDNDFEAYQNISGSALEGQVKGYDLVYNWIAVLSDDVGESETIEQLFVFVLGSTDR